jgi:quercetin dioxygenase-like cupin family protein
MNKSSDNKSTLLRPEGKRTLNAPLVEIDLNKFIKKIKHEVTWAENDQNVITIFKSEHSTIVLMGMKENAELKTHTANGNVIIQVLEGEINFKTDLHSTLLEKGQMIVLQANIQHSVVAIIESFFLLTINIEALNYFF